jgi:hypothetical protein
MTKSEDAIAFALVFRVSAAAPHLKGSRHSEVGACDVSSMQV